MTNTQMERNQLIAAARDESTPAEVLAQLAGDVNWYVRGAATSNPNTPREQL